MKFTLRYRSTFRSILSVISKSYFAAQHATDSFEFFKSHSETRVAMFFSASKVPQILSEITDHVTANYNW